MEDSGLTADLDLPFEEAIIKARVCLRAEGFSILSEMKPPVQLGEGVGRRHLFMTVWQQATGNPDLDLPGLDIGDHLQCAVAVYEQEGRTVVAALDPAAGMQGWEHEGKAAAASRALEAALGRVAAD